MMALCSPENSRIPSSQAKTQNLVTELALLGILAFLWGSSYLLTRLAVETSTPLTLVAIRVSVAALFLVLVMRVQGAHLPTDALAWRRLLLQAFFNSIGAWTLAAWGQQYIDSALAGVLNSTSPILCFSSLFQLRVTKLLTRASCSVQYLALSALC
jgi:drug/metabolite transporter (DMT)-like permease